MKPGRSGRGRFVTFEGGEGAGKSTQVRRLAARLEERGIRAVLTREPGGSPRAEEIRALILSGATAELGAATETVLFYAARADHLAETIRPALASGAWVVCDRFSDSTRAYQGAAGGVDPKLIAALEKVVVGGTKPDLTIVLDLPARDGMARAASRRGAAEGADRFEAEGMAFHERLRKAFLRIAKDEPHRCAVVDAALPEDDVADSVWNLVLDRLLQKTVRPEARS
jgi:dTMP kinase